MKTSPSLLDDAIGTSVDKTHKHIEIVSSTVSGLSSMSDQSRQAIYDVLDEHYTNVGITIVNDLADLEVLVASGPDVVFLGMKYLPLDPDDIRGPNKLWLYNYLSRRDIACTGSDHHAHKLELNKSLAKQRVSDAGLNTSPYFVIQQDSTDTFDIPLHFPLFVKPTDRGGGEGIDSSSVVSGITALRSKVQHIKQTLRADSLVEQYLPGREFSVAILKDQLSDDFLSLPVELIAGTDKNGMSLLSSEVKQNNSEIVRRVDDKGLHDKLCTLALSAFHALGAQDYGRIDIRLDEAGVPNFLEANLIPSLIKNYGSFPKACMLNLQLDYTAMIINIVELAQSRRESLALDETLPNPSYAIAPTLLGLPD